MTTAMEQLRSACERDLGDPEDWPAPVGYPNSLALCIIDAMYVTGARYTTVARLIDRYREFRAARAGDADTDGAPELLASVEQVGGPHQWADVIGNRRPTSTAKGAPLRAVALVDAARSLVGAGIRTTADLRALADDGERWEDVKVLWCEVPGHRSGYTWSYLVMLAQDPGATAERYVLDYITRQTGVGQSGEAVALLGAVAETAGWDAGALHHALWRFEARRPRELPSSA